MLLTPTLALAALLQATTPTAPAPQPAAAEQELPAGHRRMLAALEQVRVASLADDYYVGGDQLERLREVLDGLGGGKLLRRAGLLRKLGWHCLRVGRTEEALEHLQAVVALRPRLEGKVPPGELDQDELELALAWLRLGETRNCVAHHGPESCILPIRGDGVHREREGSREALVLLEGLVARHPEHLTSRWLLNVAAMTLGLWPEGVPEEHRVPEERFAEAPGFPRFPEVAGALGLDALDMCGGAVADDFDGDGLLDLVVTSWDPAISPVLHAGTADGGFVRRDAGLAGLFGGLNLVQADFDNDGDTDLLVLRGAWLSGGGRVPNSLLANRGDGTFVDVTFEAGLGEVHLPTQTAAWADYDNDGDLDLYVGNESTDQLDAPCQLFRNGGDGTFVDVAESAGVQNGRFTKGVTWGDHDGDRLPDLYVSNRDGKNRLYHNRGDGTFEDRAAEAGVVDPRSSFPAWFFDFDNDGHLDLYVATWERSVEPVAAHYLGAPLPAGTELARLYRGDGKGGFEDVAPALGLTEPTVTMGCNFGDLDLDGWLDFYLGTGYPGYEGLMPNKMYRNRAGRAFEDVTTAGGFGHVQKGHGVVLADLDADGDTDVFEQVGGAYPGDAFRNALFQNPGFENHWITLRLRGTSSNRSAIGARIRCQLTKGDTTRSVYRHVNSGGSFGGNPLAQTVGLGSAERVDVLEVYWPTSDLTQRFTDVPADRTYELIEGEDELLPLTAGH